MTAQTDPQNRRALLQNALVSVDKMQKKLKKFQEDQREPIAIIGMACRFPGEANTPEEFWQLLLQGVDAVTEVPPERWDLDEVYDPDPDAPGKSYSKWGAFIKDVDQFDANFFGIAPREANSMDPQQRLLLEVTWEALERAAIAPASLEGSRTGVFIGLTTNDYSQRQGKVNDPTLIDTYFGAGVAHSITAGRLSYTLGLHGPNMAIDTACSSSLVAAHVACQSLRTKESNMAIAGAANLTLLPEGSITTSRSRMMSFNGRCKTFDASADGYVRGEGSAVMILKRLSDATADGDNILAVIQGTALNQDGRSNGLTAPNGQAQRDVIRAALTNANVAPEAISYVETHGTGTTLGDPIEVNSLGDVFGTSHDQTNPLWIGSVKTNVGHLEAAAGIVGLFKIVLALQHKTIPPHLHFNEPNPYIDWANLPIKVPTTPVAWETAAGKPRVAGLSSFGFSGTNAHMIIAEAPQLEPASTVEKEAYLIPFSAKNEQALAAVVKQTAVFLQTHPDTALADTAYTLSVGRDHFDERLAFVAANQTDAIHTLNSWLDTKTAPGIIQGQRPKSGSPEIAFLFTGQGSQYANMGRQLFEAEPVFRETLIECDRLLQSHLDRSLLSILFPAEDAPPETMVLIDQTQYTQPALFAIEYALATLWQSWGIQPAAVMGHSVGEYVAACIAGVFTLEDGLKLIAARGRLMGALPSGGTMAAVFADEDVVQTTVTNYAAKVSIAAVNGPNNVVISGDETAVAALIDQFSQQGYKSRRLTVSHAFHSPLMEPMLDEFAHIAASINFAPPTIELISNLRGEPAGPEIETAVYWRDHVRAPVRFADAMNKLAERGFTLFLECGPQPTLSGMGLRCLPDSSAIFVPSMRPNVADTRQIKHSLGQLYAAGIDIDWRTFYADNGQPIILPTYPFQRQRYWIDLPTKKQQKRHGETLHPLVHAATPSPLLKETVFTSHLAVDSPSYLTDHRIFNVPLFPATAYLEMAVAAAARALNSEQITLTNIQIQEAMILPEAGERLVQTAVSPLQDGQATVQIFSQAEDETWQQHVTATAQLLSPDISEQMLPAAVKARCETEIAADSYYQQMAEIGPNYGPAFRGIQHIQRRDGEAIARIELPEATPSAGYTLHPAVLDACFQVIGSALLSEANNETAAVYVPVGVTQFHVYQPDMTKLSCHVVIEDGKIDAETLRSSIHLWDDDSQLVAIVDGIQLKRINRKLLQELTKRPLADLLYETTWQATPPASAQPKTMSGHWLILADQQGIGQAVAAELENAGATTAVVPSSSIELLDPNAYEQLIAQQQPLQGILHFWSLDANLSDLTHSQAVSVGSSLYLVQALLRQQAEPRLWFFTQGAQSVLGSVPAPAQTSLWGFASTLVVEQPALQPTICDLDATTLTPETATEILTELQAEDQEDRVVWRNHTRYVARLTHLHKDTGALTIPDEQPYELFLSQQGVLDNISVQNKARQQPKADEIEIAVKATGLNFRDVLNALGMYPGPAGALGNECVGVVTAVGTDATHFSEGDAVMALGAGTFASHITTKAAYTSHTPANLDFTQSATIPITFLTAYYGLHELANIQPGDRILIHAAAGGVGMAAVQLAQAAGAVIFGTAGTPEKRDYLKSLGIPYVMNSRTLAFADEIMTITDGEGVDIVLNALADEFIPKSFSVLADNGRFLEIGKRGVWTTEQVAAFNPTLSYHLYDLSTVLINTPAKIGEMLNSLKTQFERGNLKPLPTHIFSMSQAIDAFRFMSQARHIGKIVVTQGNKLGAPVRSDGTYLITGGTGGLGLAVAQGLVDQGARYLVLLSRREPAAEIQATLEQLRANGATIITAQADISQKAEVQKIITHISHEMPPLRGIVHAAGTLDDASLPQQSWDKFQKVMASKVLGSWHLDQLTRNCPLDFFVMFSAGAALLGSPGQINYSSANAFMDGLASARHAKRLPALSISWGAWDEVGMAANLDERTRQQWQASGVWLLTPDEGVALFFQLLAQAPPLVAALPMDWRRLVQQNNALAERPFFSQVLPKSTGRTGSVGTAVSNTLLADLKQAAADEQLEILQTYVQNQVIHVLGLDASQPPDSRQGLTDIGMDSLMAVELSNRLQTGVQHPLPTTLAFEHPTIEALTAFLAAEVISLQSNEAEQTAAETDTTEDAILAEIEHLSEDDAADSLLKELEDAGY